MTLPFDRSWPARLSTRGGVVLMALPALAFHLLVGIWYGVRAWAEHLADAWRAA